MTLSLKKATQDDLEAIWSILKDAIARRKAEGSNQWQDGYPNPQTIQNDIEKSVGYILLDGSQIIGYCAIIINDEPEYAKIKGKWLSNDDFVVYHRVAIAEKHLKKGYAKQMLLLIEKYAITNQIYSVKADTNFDNIPMLRLFEKLGYKYCGKVYFRGSERLAYEKIL